MTGTLYLAYMRGWHHAAGCKDWSPPSPPSPESDAYALGWTDGKLATQTASGYASKKYEYRPKSLKPTQITCPACEGSGKQGNVPCLACEGAGWTLELSHPSRPCSLCNGTGKLGRLYHNQSCSLCNGTGQVLQ